MNKQVIGIVQISLRTRRRITLAAVLAVAATGVALGAAPATSRGPATTTSKPATNPAPNKAAANAQYLKAKELYDAGKFAEANVENDKALALDPGHGDATLMKRVLEGRLSGGPAGGGAAGAGAGKPGHLTPTQITLVKLGELTSNETNIRGRIDRAALEEFWNEVYVKDPLAGDTSPQARNAFLNVNANNFPFQVQRIRDSKQQKYMEKITLTSDPGAIAAFRTGPHTYMMANCATSECHSSEKAGNFRLLPAGAAAAPSEVIYTNFYIMSMYAGKDGKMIDRDNPEKSLFLQYSLPWSSTAVKHPKTDIKKIPNVGDGRYRSMLEWVRALNLPRPNYGITFEVPGAK